MLPARNDQFGFMYIHKKTTIVQQIATKKVNKPPFQRSIWTQF